ncbi:MAG: ATP-grasp domain-containing protein [Rhodospirillaceae bacterium]|nr:ATP-grasp domain-containing protein [Rhodospirillaceae bacterium]
MASARVMTEASIAAIHMFDGPNIDLPTASVRLTVRPDLLPPVGSVDRAAVLAILEMHVLRRGSGRLSPEIEAMFGAAQEADLASWVSALAIELQRLFDEDVAHWKVGRPRPNGNLVVCYAYENRDIGSWAGPAACDLLVMAAVGGGGTDGELPRGLRRFLQVTQARCRDDLMVVLLREIKRRGIPYRRLVDSGRTRRLLQLGHGVHQRQANGTVTDRSSAVANIVTASKHQTLRMLDRVGVPVPRQRMVTSNAAAKSVAEVFGYPLVVKPDRGTGGIGITAGVADEAELFDAIARARPFAEAVAVEEFIEGEDRRLMMCDGKMVAATQRLRAQVVGDGRQSIRSLIEEVNADPRRGEKGVSILTRLEIDAAMLAVLTAQGITPDDVPARDQRVLLRTTANLKSGGQPVDVTDQVHPDNRLMAEVTADAIGLDICGVDFVTTDISRSWREIRSAVVEVNLSASVAMYDFIDGDRHGVVRKAIEVFFPQGSDGRIPLLVVAAGHAERALAVARCAADRFVMLGKKVALSDGQDVWLDEHVCRNGCETVAEAAEMLLAHPHSEVAILALDAPVLLKSGLPWPDCDLAVLDPDGLDGRSLEVLGVLARAARRGVLKVGSEENGPSLLGGLEVSCHVHLPMVDGADAPDELGHAIETIMAMEPHTQAEED